jgi:signal transduction histidine kinase
MSEDGFTRDWPGLIAGGMFDLKTPVVVVQGYVRLLNSERGGPLTEQQCTYLQAAEHASRQISQIVVALAGLASLQGAWSTSKSWKENVSLCKLLAEVADLPFLQEAARVDVQALGQYDEVIAAPRLLSPALVGLARFVARDQRKGERPLSIWIVDPLAAPERCIVPAATEQIQEAVKTPRERLTFCDERAWRLSMDCPSRVQ